MTARHGWPATEADLVAEQERLAVLLRHRRPVRLTDDALVAGVFVCFDDADRAYAGAALLQGRRVVGTSRAVEPARHPYRPGLLALREGEALEAAVRGLPAVPDVLLVNATGSDHPRGAGLAVQLGFVLDVPTVGVTDRPLVGISEEPGPQRGALARVTVPSGGDGLEALEGHAVAAAVRTRAGTRPLVVHAAWRTDLEGAVALVLAQTGRARTPEPIRRARETARRLRTRAGYSAERVVVADLLARYGGREALRLGVRLDGPESDAEAERWFLAATLHGTRISSEIAERTFGVLTRAGVRTVADAGRRTWQDLVELLDEGGYARYDERTATRLHALAEAVERRFGGRVATLRVEPDPDVVRRELDDLPGWGEVTVRVFLRELRGVWPGADTGVDQRALRAAEEYGLRSTGDARDPRTWLADLAAAARADQRDVENALIGRSLRRGG